jgi:hypothetical protein
MGGRKKLMEHGVEPMTYVSLNDQGVAFPGGIRPNQVSHFLPAATSGRCQKVIDWPPIKETTPCKLTLLSYKRTYMDLDNSAKKKRLLVPESVDDGVRKLYYYNNIIYYPSSESFMAL